MQPDGEKVCEVIRDGNHFQCGDWMIEAELNAQKPAGLAIKNSSSQAMFHYGSKTPLVDGKKYTSYQKGTSLLYDKVNGRWQVQEMADREAQPTGPITNK